MSKTVLGKLGNWVRHGLVLGVSVQMGCLAFLFAVWLAAPASAQDVGDIVAASKALAEGAPLELTRLAMQVAIVSMLINVTLIFAAFRIAFVWLRKPCLLTGEQAHAILREAVRQASLPPKSSG